MDRIQALSEILSADPANSFARYGLAMEQAKAGETEAALATFALLKPADREFTAGLFMAAQTLAAADRTPEAIQKLKLGIEAAKQTGNNHALNEMQSMLDDLER